jgi:hypothetical protein
MSREFCYSGYHLMSLPDQEAEIRGLLKAGYGVPPPAPSFIDSLGSQLAKTLAANTHTPNGLPCNEIGLASRRSHWGRMFALAATFFLVIGPLFLVSKFAPPDGSAGIQSEEPSYAQAKPNADRGEPVAKPPPTLDFILVTPTETGDNRAYFYESESLRGRPLGLEPTPLLLYMAPKAGSPLSGYPLRKEPTYKTKPQYALVVFGLEGKTKQWIVLDGEILYVDRDGNGNLTEKGKRFEPSAFKDVPISEPRPNGPVERSFEIGDVVEAGGKTKHTKLQLRQQRWEKKDSYVLYVLIDGKHEQVAVVGFADKPQEASVVWFHGPLSMRLYFNAQSLSRGPKPSTLSFCLGTPGLNAVTTIDQEIVPADVHPIADIAFPPKTPGGPSLKTRLLLDHRC